MSGLLRFANLLPVALLGAYFVVGFLLFCWRTFVHGSYRDPEIAGRPTSVLLGAWIRNYFAWLMLPVVALLVAAGVPPDAITSVSVLFALAAGVSMAVGQFALGGGLYLAAGICDYLDGRVARICRQTTSRGAALDSILDRYAEAAMIIGLAWFYRDQWVLLALLMFLSGSFLVPYIRARGESLGIDMKVGLMQRPERLVLLGLAALACPLVDWMLPAAWQVVPHPMVVAAIVLLAVSTQCTAAYRLWYVGSLLDADGAKRPPHKTSREVTIGNTLVTVLDFAIVVLAVGRTGLAGLAGHGVVVRRPGGGLFCLAAALPGAGSCLGQPLQRRGPRRRLASRRRHGRAGADRAARLSPGLVHRSRRRGLGLELSADAPRSARRAV